jgi:hypothetical protein
MLEDGALSPWSLPREPQASKILYCCVQLAPCQLGALQQLYESRPYWLLMAVGVKRVSREDPTVQTLGYTGLDNL